MSAMIAGAAPILPAFTASGVGAKPQPGLAVALPGGVLDDRSADAPLMPLFERRINAAERSASLAPDLDDAILRIEGLYDPTRIDAAAPQPPMRVFPGTASMSNVFADRWHLGDTDANVSYAVRYIAQAWQQVDAAPCSAFVKHRPTFDIIELTSPTAVDCARIDGLRGAQDTIWTRLPIARAAVSVPIFAAPEPGARMSSANFWAAQRARIAAIKARIEFQRRRPAATLALQR